MRINKKYLSSKYIIIAVVAAIALVGALSWWYVSQRDSSSSDADQETTNVEPAPAQLSDEEAAAKQKFIEGQESQSAKDGSTPNTGDEQSKPLAKVELSARQQVNSVTITSELSGIGDGTCTLRVTNGTKSYTQEVEVIFQPTFSTCAGFSVPVGEVGSGTWNIQVEAVSLDGVKSAATTSLGVS